MYGADVGVRMDVDMDLDVSVNVDTCNDVDANACWYVYVDMYTDVDDGCWC